MIKRSIDPEDKSIVTIYASDIRAPKYISKNRTKRWTIHKNNNNWRF